MNPSAREAYIVAQVNTATPHKLHLMLLDGFLRFGAVANESWGENVVRDDALGRCRRIALELLTSVRAGESDLSDKLAQIYHFVYRTIIDAQVNTDRSKLGEAVQVVEVERETWRQVCEKFGSRHDDSQSSTSSAMLAPHLGQSSITASAPSAGFSFEA